MISSNPFTPQSGWEPKTFGGRKEEINLFKEKLKKGKVDKIDHIIILGEWGIGKTSLLKYYKKLAQEERHLATLCPIGKFTENDRTIDGVYLILEELTRGFPIKGVEKVLEHIEGAGITIAGTGAQVTRKTPAPQPQTLLTDKLLEVWKKLKTDLAVVLLDDVHNFSSIFQMIDILRLVLSRDEIIKNTRYLFVLSSTPEGWQRFVNKHDPIGRFFRTRQSLSKLSKEQTIEIIEKTLDTTGVVFSPQIIENTYKYTEGHPYELQVLCSNLYESQIEGKVESKIWDKALETTLRDLGRDYFDTLFGQITEREKPALEILAEANCALTLQEIQSRLSKKKYPDYPVRDTKNYIYRLVDKKIVKKVSRGQYQIFDRMFREYFLFSHS